MSKANQKQHREIMHIVLLEISEERRHSHDELRAAYEQYESLVRNTNEENKAVVKAYNDAISDSEAMARYEAHMPKAEYDAKNRPIQQALEVASAAHAAAKDAAMKRIAPSQARIQAIEQKLAKLAAEWLSHQRTAKAAGIDLKSYWTPEAAILKVTA